MRLYYWAEHTSRYASNTGIQRVTRCLARALSDGGHGLLPVKGGEDRFSFVPLSAPEREHLARWNGPRADKLLPAAGGEGMDWLLLPEPCLDPARPSFKELVSAARSYGARVAAVFYDALPHTHPRFFPGPMTRVLRRFMDELALADAVLPISAASGKDLLAYWKERGILDGPAAAAKVRPCPLAAEFFETPRVTAPLPAAQGPLTVLSVGTVEPRKNHLALVRAFFKAAGKNPGLRLVIAGGGTPYPKLSGELESLIASRPDLDVRWERKVDDALLARLYAECAFTVYPSVAEGFGLPIVESLWHGRPVVCHNDGALRETASPGGCLLADTGSEEDLAEKISRMAGDAALRGELARKAAAAPLKTWARYGEEVASALETSTAPSLPRFSFDKPLLSICVTTYNRAKWLAHSLRLILEQTRPYQDAVEVVVCDNASPDETQEVVRGLGHYANLYYYRNEKNVGMLGNLAVTCNKGRGKYIWVIGDDDLLVEGTVERVLTAILRRPESELIYLNYAITRFDKPQDLKDAGQVVRRAQPISRNLADEFSPRISAIAAKTENCFTAIYCLIYRADHARRAYNQDTSGRPFSTLSTCVPTADYICRNMFDRPGYWIGDPCVVVNFNVSWMRYASLYILERFPELFDLMEANGADRAQVDALREYQVPNLLNWFEQIHLGAQRENLPLFSPERFLKRFSRLPAFQRHWKNFLDIYEKAHRQGLCQDPSLTPEKWREQFLKYTQENAHDIQAV